MTLTGGNRHDSTQLIPLVDAIPVIRGKHGRPRQRPRWLYGDRADDSDQHRQALRDKGITPRIARKNTTHGSGLGKTRWVVERSMLRTCERTTSAGRDSPAADAPSAVFLVEDTGPVRSLVLVRTTQESGEKW